MSITAIIRCAALVGFAAGAAAPLGAQLSGLVAPEVQACYRANGTGVIYRLNVPGAPTACIAGDGPFHWARGSINGLAVMGTLGQGSIPASGPGVRMMWYPRKAAFRAGVVDGLRAAFWDDANIGE